jgi:hypothetical protein
MKKELSEFDRLVNKLVADVILILDDFTKFLEHEFPDVKE